ncbi:endonuclease/exonuclease/phosphatase family protein [bacterium]|nr:endonuclease/exonuclease/phosphatase family protein [bacterium]
MKNSYHNRRQINWGWRRCLAVLLLLGFCAGGMLSGCSDAQAESEEVAQAEAFQVTQAESDQVAQAAAQPEQVAQAEADEMLMAKRKRKKHYSNQQQSADAPGLVNAERIAPPAPGTLRLASWNMHDLFDTIDDANKDVVLTPQEYSQKLAVLAAVLNKMRADIVGVQEVENIGCLRDLAKRAGYPYCLLVEGNDTMRGIDVGVLSKVPIKNYVTHAQDSCPGSGRSYRFSRDCLEVHFDHPSRLTMLVNHFKSKRGSNDDVSAAQRQAQANRVRNIAASLQKYPVIIVGDLNDEPDSKALSPLVRGAGLHDVLSWMGASRVSFKTRNFSSALDYLILNDLLYSKMIDRSARIVVGEPVRIASDHRPVIVDVRL